MGIGNIFNLFLKGIIDSDDEVAVTFTGYREYQSDALIDIRYNLFLAQKKQIIDKNTKEKHFKNSKKNLFSISYI